MSEAASSLTEANSAFWAELCGTAQARALGAVDSSPPSLKKFDDWYFEFYPYLARHIRFDEVRGRRVLEVGLGYGTVSQRLAQAGADYQGLDISPGPVAMVNQRLRQANLPGSARQGDVLSCPFDDATFDRVVAIGCYHHTGDLARAIAETRRVLKPGGTAILMVYNAYSYRRWIRWFGPTFAFWMWDRFGIGRPRTASVAERFAYDPSVGGGAAPETVFVSASFIRKQPGWSRIDVYRENIGSEFALRFVPRTVRLTALGPFFGLDLYCHMTK